ncbi:MAG: RNA methyltransferase [Bacteroidales bacterium]|nr:RNA methyltransferase [Bacteroidales bacterium]MBN2817927.1 RNA methyltransferase [Bacteroidales bacterium]
MLSKNKIQFLKKLQQKKYRDFEKMYFVEGIKIVNEACSNIPQQVSEVICTGSAREKLVIPEGISISETDRMTIKQISSLKTPQEAVAVIKIDDAKKNPSQNSELILALDSARDPGNMGTIIRLADWFGIETILCSEDCVDCYNPKVIQATMGAIFRVNMVYCNLKETLTKFRLSGKKIIGASLKGENLYKSAAILKGILVMGNESTGISDEIQQIITHSILIPNFSKKHHQSESLNVSTATAVILGELKRRIDYSK